MNGANLRRTALVLWTFLFTTSGCNLWRPAVPDAVPLAVGASCEEGVFLAGASVVDITPETDVWLGGYDRLRKSRGVHDPITARALVLRRGSLEVALVSVDVIGLQGPDVDAIRARAEGFDASNLIVAATHTHAGPDTLGLWGYPPFYSGRDDDYMEQLFDGVVAALEGARQALVPAEVAAGALRFDPEGILYNLRHPGLEDHDLTVLHVRQAGAGGTIATLVELGCHPEVLGRSNRKISADFPHWTVAQLEKELGGIGLFVAGAVGGLVTPDVERGEDWKGGTFEQARELGERVGGLALEQVRALDFYESQPVLASYCSDLYLHNDNWLYDIARWTGMVDRAVYDGGYLRTQVNRMQVGDLRIVTVPGEITPDLGLRIKRQYRGTTLLVGLGNDELGYLLPELEYESPLFDYERTLCVSARAGERVVRRLGDLELVVFGGE